MDAIIELLQRNARLSAAQIADRLNLKEAEVAATIAGLEKSGLILGYHAIIDSERCDDESVTALIEIKLTPEREGGFDHLASRIAKFDQVRSCYLMSGAYDLAVIVQCRTLKEVASFVAEKLSTIAGVVSTATHFQLKTYKQNGFLFCEAPKDQRPKVS